MAVRGSILNGEMLSFYVSESFHLIMKPILLLAWTVLVLFFEPRINQADIDHEEILEEEAENGVEEYRCNTSQVEQTDAKVRVKDIDCFTGNGTYYRGNGGCNVYIVKMCNHLHENQPGLNYKIDKKHCTPLQVV